MLKAIDHVVLTATDIRRTIRFYEDVLEVPVLRFGQGRYALQIGAQKINLHEANSPFEPNAACPTPGSLDICLLTDTPIGEVIKRMDEMNVSIEVGPVQRTGATGPIRSIYVRDPDGNLIEIANQG